MNAILVALALIASPQPPAPTRAAYPALMVGYDRARGLVALKVNAWGVVVGKRPLSAEARRVYLGDRRAAR